MKKSGNRAHSTQRNLDKPNFKFNKLAIAVTAALSSTAAVAQDREEETASELLQLEEVVSTGTTSSTVTKLSSSLAITTANAETLSREAPLGIADSLELVPGFFVEDSGGEVSNNVAPRGLGGGSGFSFISIQEDGVPVMYEGSQVDSLQRYDITIDRIEAVRGGSAGTLTVNGAGGVVNYITKKGTEDPEGMIRLTLSDYGTFRPEFSYTGPLSEDWLVATGGYYRTSEGVRDPGFTADEGGQFRINLTRKLDNGELTFHLKKVNDTNTFYLPVPLTNESDPESIPGIDATTETMLSLDNSQIVHKTPFGRRQTNLQDGFHTDATVGGITLDLEFDGGWSMRNAARATKFDLDINAVFNNNNSTLIQVEDFLFGSGDPDIPDTLVGVNGTDVVAEFGGEAALRYVDTGEFVSPADYATLNGNGLVVSSIALSRQRNVDQLVNDLRFTHETDRNSLSFGLLYVSADASDGLISSTFLGEVKHQPRRLDLVAVDDINAADPTVLGFQTDSGILQYGTWYSNNRANVTSYSLYVSDDFSITDDFRIDASLRYENAKYTAVSETVTQGQILPGAFDENGDDRDNIVANNTINNFGDGGSTTLEETYDEVAFSVGFNWTFTDNMAFYGRYSDAFKMPVLESVGTIAPNPDGSDRVETLEFFELGYRYSGRNIAFSGTLFSTLFENLRINGQRIDNQESEFVVAETEAMGLEWEFVWNPVPIFSLEGLGVFQETEVSGIPGDLVQSEFNGNQVTRTPDTQIRVTPTLHLGNFDVFLTVHHLGDRFADLANDAKLPSYETVDLGVVGRFGDFTVQFKGTNLTDAVGLTEGNPRAGFSSAPVTEFYFARPILGPTFLATMTYEF